MDMKGSFGPLTQTQLCLTDWDDRRLSVQESLKNLPKKSCSQTKFTVVTKGRFPSYQREPGNVPQTIENLDMATKHRKPHFQFQHSSPVKLFSSNGHQHRLMAQEAGGGKDGFGVAATLQRNSSGLLLIQRFKKQCFLASMLIISFYFPTFTPCTEKAGLWKYCLLWNQATIKESVGRCL